MADEDGCVKLFRTYKKLKIVKGIARTLLSIDPLNHDPFSIEEVQATKSCIYALEWLSGQVLACGGGDHSVHVYDVDSGQRVAHLRGHTESVKAIASVPDSAHVLASGSRDGSVLVFDLRCNRMVQSDTTEACVRAMHSIPCAHSIENAAGTPSCHRSVLKSKASNMTIAAQHHHQHLNAKPSPVACLSFQNECSLVSVGATDGFVKVRSLLPFSLTIFPVYCSPRPDMGHPQAGLVVVEALLAPAAHPFVQPERLVGAGHSSRLLKPHVQRKPLTRLSQRHEQHHQRV